MATIVKAPSKAWKAVIRRKGWPTVSKSFRTRRDAEDWASLTEDEMIRGVHIKRSPSESMTIDAPTGNDRSQKDWVRVFASG